MTLARKVRTNMAIMARGEFTKLTATSATTAEEVRGSSGEAEERAKPAVIPDVSQVLMTSNGVRRLRMFDNLILSGENDEIKESPTA